MTEIQFHNGESNLTLAKIQFDSGRNQMERNPISHWKKSKFTLEEIQFHNGRTPISRIRHKRDREERRTSTVLIGYKICVTSYQHQFYTDNQNEHIHSKRNLKFQEVPKGPKGT